jgi:hypothetical protein
MYLTERRVRQVVEDAGLILSAINKPRSGHYHLRVTRPDGFTAMFVMASTAGDSRALLNETARLRRFARGAFNPIQERTQK